MKNSRIINLFLCIAFCFIASQTLQASDAVYESIYRELSKHDNRLPGSAGYLASRDAIIAQLKQQGLEVGVQTYNTYIPKTLECNFNVAGKTITGIHPVQPNQFATTTTSGNTLVGPLLYLGKAEPKDIDNNKIRGSIVLVDINTESTPLLFNMGALAVIYIGNDNASQWEMHYHGIENPIQLPRAFISKENAERQGLLSSVGQQANIRITTKWTTVQAENIWVHLPATVNDDDATDSMLLTATYDTFGFVPDYCPQLREAANVALLAQTISDLKSQKRSRDIIAVFLGSHYSAQEGARYVHWVAYNSMKNDKPSTYFEDRYKGYEDELAYYKEMLELLETPNFILEFDHDMHREAKKAYRKSLDKVRGNLNYIIRKTALAAKAQASETLRQKEKDLRKELDGWTELLGDIMTADSDTTEPVPAERQHLYAQILKDTSNIYRNAINDIETLKKHNVTHQAFSKCFGTNRVLLHFHFDFAQDDRPWLHNFTGDHSTIYTFLRIGLGFFDTHIKTMSRIYNESNPSEKNAPLFEYQHTTIKPESLCTPQKRSHASLTALMNGIFGYSLTTVGNGLHDDNMPRVRQVNLKGLLNSIPKYINAVCNDSDINIAYTGEKFKPEDRLVYEVTSPGERKGIRGSNYVKGGTDLEGPASYALFTFFYSGELKNEQPGYTNNVIAMTDALGYAMSPHMAYLRWQRASIISYGYDEYGSINRIGTGQLNNTKNLKLFYCYGGGMIVPLFPSNYEKFTRSVYLKGKNNASFIPETTYTFENSHSMGVFTDQDEKYKAINNAGIRLLGGTDTKPIGHGLSADKQQMLNLDPVRQTSIDLVRLNESRLKNLREKNIVLEDVETLHANAKDHLEQAIKNSENLQHNKAMAHSLYAATLANHAYTPLVNTTNDMIKAVVILLLLSIPFAFSLERLFCGFTTIYKQVVGFVGFFGVTFLLLYFAHPAFSVASSPSIIFLAFVIIIMSGMVIYIIMNKFKLEILSLQGLQSSSHGSGGKGNTALASVVIGISTMRNRPLKTFLTALTIILLTFTILVFASFGSKIGVNETYVGQNSSPERIEVKRKAYMMIPQHLRNMIAEVHKEKYTLFDRGAYYPYPYDAKMERRECVLYLPKQNESLVLQAALALDQGERLVNQEVDKIYPEGKNTYDHPIYLDESVRDHLKLELGDDVTFNGFNFQFAGCFDRTRIKSLTYLDDMKLIPPDFEATRGEDKQLESTFGESLGNLLAQIDTSSFRWTPTESLALINHHDLKKIRGFNNAIIIYPTQEVDLHSDAAHIAEIFEAAVYAKNKDGIKQHFYTETFDSSGLSEIIVPLLLGGLIIFSSLLGSIVDREREIFTFSALGLAPPNVAALFFAESAVYAVLGGLGGYIISQLVAVLLAYLSDMGVFQAPEMNFSSLSSTYTILLVMATVMLSTIFPAIKAGKSANPGVARKWAMPTPDGDKMSFVFPFTVASHDLAGILRFIGEHFNNHRDASLGMFAASDVAVNALDESNYELVSTVSLAPFDLGIFQHFRLSSQESDIPGILEIVVELERVSGSPASWIRSNRQFIDDLRNQFLLWRSLPAETVAHYTQVANEQGPVHA